MPITREELTDILSNIDYKNYRFIINNFNESGWLLQAQWEADCNVSGTRELQHGRKFYVSKHSTLSEVIKTCWLAVELSIRHEAMEQFTYCGVAVFHPHTDINKLMTLHCGEDALEVR